DGRTRGRTGLAHGSHPEPDLPAHRLHPRLCGPTATVIVSSPSPSSSPRGGEECATFSPAPLGEGRVRGADRKEENNMQRIIWTVFILLILKFSWMWVCR